MMGFFIVIGVVLILMSPAITILAIVGMSMVRACWRDYKSGRI